MKSYVHLENKSSQEEYKIALANMEIKLQQLYRGHIFLKKLGNESYYLKIEDNVLKVGYSEDGEYSPSTGNHSIWDVITNSDITNETLRELSFLHKKLKDEASKLRTLEQEIHTLRAQVNYWEELTDE